MTFNEYKKMLFDKVKTPNESGIYDLPEYEKYSDSLVEKGYLIRSRFGRDKTLVFSRKLIQMFK